jgi:SAM-dependent methyltransferase
MLSEHYDLLFPHDPALSRFVEEQIRTLPNRQAALDIGCGTGSLTFDLGRHFSHVTGIDLDTHMVEKAKARARQIGSSCEFLSLDMLRIEEAFPNHQFDCITCFGNALAHLDSPKTMLRFFTSVKKKLAQGGIFLCQIIHFDHILDHRITTLPLLETDEIRFFRTYIPDPGNNRIGFRTELQEKKSGMTQKNEILLYPLRKREIRELTEQAGLIVTDYFGSFSGKKLEENDLVLIFKAT